MTALLSTSSVKTCRITATWLRLAEGLGSGGEEGECKEEGGK